MKSDDSLNQHEAYLAMLSFLEGIYARTQSDEIGVLLGGLLLMTDGLPADRAYWDEWQRAVQKAKLGEVDAAAKLSDTQPK
jgi:hypothetical protein